MKVLNIEFSSLHEEEILNQFTSGKLFTPNVDILLRLQHDRRLFEYYTKSDYVVCDSRIVRNIYRLLWGYKVPLIMGSTFFRNFYLYHKDNKRVKIFLLGGLAKTPYIAMEKINEKCGRKIVVGAYAPPKGFENSLAENKEIVKLINKSGANVLLLGLGTPKQELWIIEHENKLKNIDIYLPLGATIDFEAGTKLRAPLFIQTLALEWLFRLILEPKRLFRRYLIEDPKFFLLVFFQLIGKYRNPFETNTDS